MFLNFLVNFSSKKLEKILNSSLEKEKKHLLNNFFLILMSTFFVSFLMLLIQILGGRILGPTEYGKYSLIELIANIIAPFVSWGIPTGIIYFLAKGKYQKEFYSASFILILTSLIIVSAILYMTIDIWSLSFKIKSEIALLGILFLIPTTLKIFSSSFLKGTGKIKSLSFIESISALCGFVIFIFLLLFYNIKNFHLIVYSKACYLILAFFLSFVISVPFIGKTSTEYLKKIYSYSNYIFIGQISASVIALVDRFFINYFLGTYSLGLYQAYFFSAQAIVFQIMQSFLAIFFPLVAKARNKKAVIKKMEIVFFKTMPLIFLFDVFSTLFFLWLFGKQYPLKMLWVLLLGAQITLYVLYQLYSNSLAAISKKGAKTNACYLAIGAVVLSIISLPFTKYLGIKGAIFSRFLLYLGLIFIYRSQLKHRLKN